MRDARGTGRVVLRDNDGLIYPGRDLVHSREPQPPLPEGMDLTQLQLIFAWRSVQKEACAGTAFGSMGPLGRQAEPIERLLRYR